MADGFNIPPEAMNALQKRNPLLAAALGRPSPGQPTRPLESLTFDEVRELRNVPGVPQDLLAQLDRRTYMREFAQRNPLKAVLAGSIGIPGDFVLRQLGFNQGRSDPSLDQMFAGFQGLHEGFTKHLREKPEGPQRDR